MDVLWSELNRGGRALLERHALVVILIVILIEELGVPMPIPGDLMMMLGGIRAAAGVYPLWLVLLLLEVVTVAGATGLFFISDRCGRPFVLRYGRFIHLTPAALERAEGFLRRHGGGAIVLGRLTPGMRIFTPIAAGVLGMPYRVFLPSVAVGGGIYVAVFTLLGYFVGPQAVALLDRISIPVSALLALATLAALAFGVRRLRQVPPFVAPHPAIAVAAAAGMGLVAGVAALLAANALLDIVGFVRRLLGDAPLVTARDVGSGVRFVTTWPVFLIGAALFGLLAYTVRLQRLSPPLRVLIAAVISFALTALILYPPLGRGALVLTNRQMVRIAVDLVRSIAFGVALAAFMPLLGEQSERRNVGTSE